LAATTAADAGWHRCRGEQERRRRARACASSTVRANERRPQARRTRARGFPWWETSCLPSPAARSLPLSSALSHHTPTRSSCRWPMASRTRVVWWRVESAVIERRVRG